MTSGATSMHWLSGGGYVFNTVHNIQADVPPQNIHAMWNAWQEFSIYSIWTRHTFTTLTSVFVLLDFFAWRYHRKTLHYGSRSLPLVFINLRSKPVKAV